jgi:Zn-finger nucleic acid-binding protein
MICPLLHNEPDGAFRNVRLEGVEARVCPRCGLVFVPKEQLLQLKEESKTKQILKWP